MPSTPELQASTYKRGQKVKVVDDLPGVPAGTAGKIALANGFAWRRYWVRFANGVVLGHIDHGKLVRSKDYERFLVARDREAIEAAEAEEAAALAAVEAERVASEEGDSATGDGGADTGAESSG